MKLHRKSSAFGALLLMLASTGGTAADLNIQSGLGGTWYNRDQVGHGFFINIARVNADLKFVVSWYTYHNGAAVWLTGSQTFNEGEQSVEVPVSQFNGAQFGSHFTSDDVVPTEWGTLTFNFSSCDKGVVQYNPTLAEYDPGNIEISRLTNTVGAACKEMPSPLPLSERD